MTQIHCFFYARLLEKKQRKPYTMQACFLPLGFSALGASKIRKPTAPPVYLGLFKATNPLQPCQFELKHNT